MNRTVWRWIIVRATNGQIRLVTTNPQLFGRGKLRWDEVAFRIEIQIPDLWKKVQDDVMRIVLPQPALPTAVVVKKESP